MPFWGVAGWKLFGPDAPPPSATDGGVEWPQEQEGRDVSFDSVHEALSFLRRHVETGIALPTELPPGIDLGRGVTVYIDTWHGQRRARSDLTFGEGGHLILQFGVSMLDGCAPEHSEVSPSRTSPAVCACRPGAGGAS